MQCPPPPCRMPRAAASSPASRLWTVIWPCTPAGRPPPLPPPPSSSPSWDTSTISASRGFFFRFLSASRSADETGSKRASLQPARHLWKAFLGPRVSVLSAVLAAFLCFCTPVSPPVLFRSHAADETPTPCLCASSPRGLWDLRQARLVLSASPPSPCRWCGAPGCSLSPRPGRFLILWAGGPASSIGAGWYGLWARWGSSYSAWRCSSCLSSAMSPSRRTSCSAPRDMDTTADPGCTCSTRGFGESRPGCGPAGCLDRSSWVFAFYFSISRKPFFGVGHTQAKASLLGEACLLFHFYSSSFP